MELFQLLHSDWSVWVGSLPLSFILSEVSLSLSGTAVSAEASALLFAVIFAADSAASRRGSVRSAAGGGGWGGLERSRTESRLGKDSFPSGL